MCEGSDQLYQQASNLSELTKNDNEKDIQLDQSKECSDDVEKDESDVDDGCYITETSFSSRDSFD